MTPLHLRVDVCTYHGLRDGVPGVLEVLRRVRARATFFVAFGPDASGLALLRLLKPSFAMKMLRTNAVGSYGLATAFYGTILPAPLVGAGLTGMVRRIRDEGHEVGMHGWDHRRWQDRLPSYPRERLDREFERMVGAYREALGAEPASFAAPAWRVTRGLLELEEAAGLAWASDVRGGRPFLPRFEGRDFAVAQVPVTLPTLDEGLVTRSREDFVEEVVRQVGAQSDYVCYAAHAEMEGRGYRGELESILRRVDRTVVPLSEAARAGLPRAEIRRGRVEGRPYEVSVAEGFAVTR
ncbi:MAG: polysaccharide deacetylase family protein [Planctomycetes bacterium]|nr:polysaccharide deacetylase family protein [Planctomycetota bacterium]